MIKEVMRWRPIAPLGLPHVASSDVEIMGYTVPKGTFMFSNLFAANVIAGLISSTDTNLQNDPAIWPEPDKISPERFVNMSAEEEKRKLLTFSIGPRECVGRN